MVEVVVNYVLRYGCQRAGQCAVSLASCLDGSSQ
ncbi:hypothetical protein HDA45_006566 [Amycolatopsis umgeniensis]|uniref:Uncharacterized protein n=1 Tax=Amycolatopsis umgeniensis TaxID=336628 RepID=A0A841B663_9PSEU|nr:hypothetical protein [Amycolatopsis umgeniensis]